MKRCKRWFLNYLIGKTTLLIGGRLTLIKLVFSIGGRFTLIKLVLGTIPTYFMLVYKAPKGVVANLEALSNKFLLGIELDEKKMSLFSWKKILSQKEVSKLGVSSLFSLNHALLF